MVDDNADTQTEMVEAPQATDSTAIPPEVAAVTPPDAHEAPPVEPTRDLDKERDDRVIPVAQGVLEDLAGQTTALDINDKSEFTNVIVKILNRTLDADLNLVTDNPYIFQLIIGAFAAFNQTVMDCKMAEAQDVRYSKVAHEMMSLLASAKVPMGMGVKTEEQVLAFQAIKPQLEEIFARETLTKLEITYILEGLMNAMKVTHQIFDNNVQSAVERMEAKLLQVNDISDLTMKKLDTTLKTNIEEILKAQDA